MMKRCRHKRRPKFLESPEPVGLSAELPDLYADLPADVRREKLGAILATNVGESYPNRKGR
jgi:hypothetical protein